MKYFGTGLFRRTVLDRFEITTLYIYIYIYKILLTCALRAYNSILFLEKGLSGIEKALTIFSIPNKIFPRIVYYCVCLDYN